MPIIRQIELYAFENEMPDCVAQTWAPGQTGRAIWFACRMETHEDVTGEHFTWARGHRDHWKTAQRLIGSDALDREALYQEFHPDPCWPILENTLWDIAGKVYRVPVYRLLGGSRKRLPIYASTVFGDDEPDGLNSPETYADFAEACLERGIRGFKIHPWREVDVERDIELVRAVGRRVGGRMDLMLDGSFLYSSDADILRVGKACDEAGFYWYEDPANVGAFDAAELRKAIRTPLMLGERTRGLESMANLVINGQTDFVRGDGDCDGILATMKRAYFAEALGRRIECHGWTPAQAHCVAAIHNTSYLELSLVHPKLPYESCPFMADGVRPLGIDQADADGCVTLWDHPGLGVPIDWDYVRSHAVESATFS